MLQLENFAECFKFSFFCLTCIIMRKTFLYFDRHDDSIRMLMMVAEYVF